VSVDRAPVGARIADAVDGLRNRGVPVETSAEGDLATYLIDRPTYRAEVVVNPKRWLGIEFDLLGEGGSRVLHYRVDTDLYDISQPKHHWFADEIETDIVLLLEALAQKQLLVDLSSPRARMVVPSADGPVLIRKLRFGATATPYDVSADRASHDFRSLAP
jgi:hypothetical protein